MKTLYTTDNVVSTSSHETEVQRQGIGEKVISVAEHKLGNFIHDNESSPKPKNTLRNKVIDIICKVLAYSAVFLGGVFVGIVIGHFLGL